MAPTFLKNQAEQGLNIFYPTIFQFFMGCDIFAKVYIEIAAILRLFLQQMLNRSEIDLFILAEKIFFIFKYTLAGSNPSIFHPLLSKIIHRNEASKAHYTDCSTSKGSNPYRLLLSSIEIVSIDVSFQWKHVRRDMTMTS